MDIAAAMGFSAFGGTKKRKFDQANSPKGKLDASGANSTQLGVRSKKTEKVEEHGVDDPVNSTPADGNLHSMPSQTRTPAATGMAAFLARGQSLQESHGDQAQNSLQNEADPSDSEMISFGGPPISKKELNALRSGVKDERGDTAYFLPSFVEDPWEMLKQGQNR